MARDNAKQEVVVIAPGVFDILHPGHIALLEFAKSLGDKLIVAINSDRAVKLFKGSDRPFNTAEDRKKALEEIEFVDEVIVYDDAAPAVLIRAINPSIVVKGAEKSPEEFRSVDDIPAHIEVVVFPVVMETPERKYSSTTLIEKMGSKDI